MPSTSKPPCQKETDNACTSPLSFDSFAFCFLGCFNDTMDFDYKGWVDQWMFRRKTMLEVPMRARPTTYVFSMYTEMYKTNTNYIMTRHSQKVTCIELPWPKCVTFQLKCNCRHLGGASSGHLDYSPCQPSSVSRHGIDSQEPCS